MKPPFYKKDVLYITPVRTITFLDPFDGDVTLIEGQEYKASLVYWSDYISDIASNVVALSVYHDTYGNCIDCFQFKPEEIIITLDKKVIDIKPYIKYREKKQQQLQAKIEFESACKIVEKLHKEYEFKLPLRFRKSKYFAKK